MPWAQLNAAGKQVAKEQGLFIVDMAEIARSFSPDALNVDDHHQRDWFLVEILNVYFNYLYQLQPHKFDNDFISSQTTLGSSASASNTTT
jgi:hypothetical protein